MSFAWSWASAFRKRVQIRKSFQLGIQWASKGREFNCCLLREGDLNGLSARSLIFWRAKSLFHLLLSFLRKLIHQKQQFWLSSYRRINYRQLMDLNISKFIKSFIVIHLKVRTLAFTRTGFGHQKDWN